MHISEEAFATLISGEVGYLTTRDPDELQAESVGIVLPGSFNPFHKAHQKMAELAAKRVRPGSNHVWFELSATNVEKASLDLKTIRERLSQRFGGPKFGVVLTMAPTFEEKLKLFPDCTFAVGADTILRINDIRFYQDESHRQRAFEAFRTRTNLPRFIVFGRWKDEEFIQGNKVAEPLQKLCEFVPRSEFEMQISSTEIRQSRGE